MTVQAITLKFSSPWNKPNRSEQIWSQKFHLSGEAIGSQAEAEEAALGLAACILPFNQSITYLSGWLYYPAGATINTYQATYDSGDHPGTYTAYVDSDPPISMLEVCALLRAPFGVNSKGRAKYLYKYVHNVAASGSGATGGDSLADLVTPWCFAALDTGIDSANRIPVAPDGTVPTDNWIVHPWLVTRQLRRGDVPKA